MSFRLAFSSLLNSVANAMKVHLYLSLTPESLIASMLEPVDFGKYMSLGEERRNAGVVVFFEVDPMMVDPSLRVDECLAACVAHEGGAPKRSLYISIYRVLERIPLEALGDLFLTTKAGLTLRLTRGEYIQPAGSAFLYQEFAPVGPRVVSVATPRDFCRFITDPEIAISLPRIVFADLKLGSLAADPAGGEAGNLPYPDLDHLRKCLQTLGKPGDRGGKRTKIVNRMNRLDDVFYMTQTGFHVGDASGFAFYPMPDEDTLTRDHHAWWNSAKAYRGY